jgi:superfamily II DNA or RNA helicase
VARAIAAALRPPEHASEPPSWLLPGQARSFRRALRALTDHGGALLADPVGSGKTYVALAVAEAHRAPATCLVPAVLAAQWRTVAAKLGVAIELGSHQRASRGRLPGACRGLVIIDESHHFRNPRARRYQSVAPWLVGRPVLLLSATPIVNQVDDLAHQLLLGVRDDALLPDGVASLRGALARGETIPSLGRLVIEERGERGPRPARRPLISLPGGREQQVARALVSSLRRLRLSRDASVAALVRGVLLRAAASSAPALADALRRYRALLRHAADAAAAGRKLGRSELRELTGELDDQLVLWQLLAAGQPVGPAPQPGAASAAEAPEAEPPQVELHLDDLDDLDPLIAEVAALAAGADLKVDRLRTVLADGRPTLVFTTRQETVRHLRERLGPPVVAWCTGSRAGIGHLPASRAAVLRWFRQPDAGVRLGLRPPACLVCTDVAAEGLDFHRAERVVHYDLPWTPMRLEQREGRAVRLGSAHGFIEVVRFVPPPAVESALRLNDRLARKATLPARAGLGPDGLRVWGWRSTLADQLDAAPGQPATASVRGRGEGALIGFELFTGRGVSRWTLATGAGWLDADTGWTEDPELISDRLLHAASCRDVRAAPAERLRCVLESASGPLRARLAAALGRRWSGAGSSPVAVRLVERLGPLVTGAVRRRQPGRLDLLERALAFAARGHTAGEAMLIERVTWLEARELLAALAKVAPAAGPGEVVELRLTGVVLFER